MLVAGASTIAGVTFGAWYFNFGNPLMSTTKTEAMAFEQLLTRRPKGKCEELSELAREVLLAAYDSCDHDEDGMINVAELRRALVQDALCRSLLSALTPDGDPDEVVEQMDANHDGVISFGEFLLYFEGCSAPQGCLAGVQRPDSDHVWGYEGVLGPKHWSKLSAGNSLARCGHAQSPINITSVGRSTAGGVIQYVLPKQGDAAPTATLSNNGHTIVVAFGNNGKGGGGRLTASGVGGPAKNFVLRQLHFHAESEHTVDGRRYPLEMHLVHVQQTRDGGLCPEGSQLAVVGVLFQLGSEPSDFLRQILESGGGGGAASPMPGEGKTWTVAGGVSLAPLGLLGSAVTRYDGSLTTPPCSEEVLWCVADRVQTMTAEQLGALTAQMPANNFRPTQPLNGRTMGSAVMR